MSLTIWVDADACPRQVKDVVLKASKRTQTPLIFVANQPLRVTQTSLVRFVLVSRDFDAADHFIAPLPTASMHSTNPTAESLQSANDRKASLGWDTAGLAQTFLGHPAPHWDGIAKSGGL